MSKEKYKELLELLSSAMGELFSYQDWNNISVAELTEAINDEHPRKNIDFENVKVD